MFPILGDSTLPDLGVDVPSMVTALGVKLGAIIAVGVALTAAVVAIYKGVKYFRKAG